MATAHLILLKAAFRAITSFVPRKRYEAKVAEAADVERKDREREALDLGGWRYRRKTSTDGTYEHRFYHHPSQRPGAPTLLMLHGLFLDGRSFLHLDELARDYELIAYDFPEDWDGYHGGLDDFVELIDDLAQVLGVESFHLAGSSFGGMVAMYYAAGPARTKVRSLILISTRIPGIDEKERAQGRFAAESVRSFPDYRLYWLLEKGEALFSRKFKGYERERLEPILVPKNIAYYRQVTQALRDYDGLERAKRIEVPVLVLAGTKDSIIPVGAADDIANAIPWARVERLEGKTHVMVLVNGEELATRIASFLEQRSGGFSNPGVARRQEPRNRADEPGSVVV